MSNQADHTIVRLRVPPELKQKIEESAEKNNRSQSAEMVARLESSFSSNTEMDEFVLFLEASLKERTDSESNKILVNLLKNWLRFKKAP
ncbi:Arc family DNA-binding protein [Acinetobacter sp. CFCC 10889]|uniref:Arc family DNA-binding protein n=1 Tax=Acinetobacter sp. CFCC 10889 TaxID=1775557 RepID=UPI000DD08207|nr:Arc family DNA-binding protein [Acinetobacter sp. CFCC 10889]